MKEVILHIGLHKTGSTSIQKALKNYNKDGVKAIGFNEENHSIPMYTIFSENRYDYHIWTNSGATKDQINQRRETYLKILTDHVNDENNEKLIISGEDISVLSAEEKHKLIKFFTKLDISIKVIVYVRSPLDWSASVYQQMVKDGHTPKGKIATNYKNRLNPFLELLGKNNTLVFSFNDVQKNYRSIINHFSDVLKIKLPDLKKENESITEFQLALICSLNSIKLQTNGNRHRYRIRRKMVEIIREYRCESLASKKLDKKYFVPLLHDMVEKDVEWLSDNFDIKFTEISNKSNENIDDYLSKKLQVNHDHVANVFQNIGVSYREGDSITDNFLNAFIFLETGNKRFDPIVYLELNSDVKAAGANPYQHYLEFGIKKGRRIR